MMRTHQISSQGMLAIAVTIPALLIFYYTHTSLSRLLILRKACKRLRTWQHTEGKITSVSRKGPAAFHNPWEVHYEFETESGETQTGRTFFNTNSEPFQVVSYVDLLYDPAQPSLSRLELKLRACEVLERNEFRVKSDKRILTELLIHAFICLAFAVGSVVMDSSWSASPGGLILLYLFSGGISMGCGVLQSVDLWFGKLRRDDEK